MTATTTFQALASSFIGSAVLSTDKTGEVSKFTVARLDSKIGTMKDGTKAEYTVLTRQDDDTVFISIHPNVAKKLFSKGEVDSFKLEAKEEVNGEEAPKIDEVVKADEVKEEVKTEVVDEVNGDDVKVDEVKTEEAGKPAAEEEVKPVKVSKKDQAVAIYLEVVNGEADAKKHRSAVIARFISELGMGSAGASTYYQNCKGTKAVKWTVTE